MKRRIRHLLSKNLLLALLLLFAANVVMGTVMAIHSQKTYMKLIELRMLDISNTAADMLNGDEMELLTAEDENTQPYQNALNTLKIFQDNIELKYIYAINLEPDNSFSFSVDPAIADPGEFGSPVVTTDALKIAASGISAVDKHPYEDAWGKFYSSYSPVFDSDHHVAAIVAVDFDADMINDEIFRHILIILVILVVIMILGILFALSISFKSRQRSAKLKQEMAEIQNEFNDLDKIMLKSSLTKLKTVSDDNRRTLLQTLASGETYGKEEDEISGIGNDLHSVQETLKRYIRWLNEQTFIDPMTGVNNKSAYQVAIRNLNQMIEEHNTKFTVAFFDINELKSINTRYGFEVGDELMLATADALKNAFTQKHVYRVASDEFIVILEDKSSEETQILFDTFEGQLSEFNHAHPKLPNLTVASGMCGYIPNETPNYRQVFIRAEAAMRQNKAAFYEKRNPKPAED